MTISKVLYSSKQEDYQTPKWLYDKLNEEFHFDLDPCTSPDNPLGTKYFMTKQIDGLAASWHFAKSVYINPPYNREIAKWLSKVSSSLKSKPDQTVVMLLLSRTGTKWFHQYIYEQPNVRVRLLKGRLKFENTLYPAPFDSMVVIFSSS
jgi:phage N-6-adenine-methyltransferase